MKSLYLLLSIAGFIAPNIFVAIESIETGNWLLWLDPAATLNGMFGNRISTAFVVDLLGVVLVALIWMWTEGSRLKMKNLWMYPVLTLLFGLAGPLPMFLYNREKLGVSG
jgi:hypothetical protein